MRGLLHDTVADLHRKARGYDVEAVRRLASPTLPTQERKQSEIIVAGSNRLLNGPRTSTEVQEAESPMRMEDPGEREHSSSKPEQSHVSVSTRCADAVADLK